MLHPTIKAVKDLLTHLQSTRGVLLYIDLHGHSRKKNCFVYGCDVALQPEKWTKYEPIMSPEELTARRIFSRIFPKVLSMVSNCHTGGYFSFKDCSFKVQKSKAGTGRVISWKTFGIQAAYTVELSFCGNGNNDEAHILRTAIDKRDSCSLFPSDSSDGLIGELLLNYC